MLEGAGFEVVDLRVDVDVHPSLDSAKGNDADILALAGAACKLLKSMVG
jgi:methanogenic corrinoid protein MtbC1